MTNRVAVTALVFQQRPLANAFKRILVLLVQRLLERHVLPVLKQVVNVISAVASHFNWTWRLRRHRIAIWCVMHSRDVELHRHVCFWLCIWLALVNAVQWWQKYTSTDHRADVLVPTADLGLDLDSIFASGVGKHNLLFLLFGILFITSTYCSK